jgi:hypothetical protein
MRSSSSPREGGVVTAIRGSILPEIEPSAGEQWLRRRFGRSLRLPAYLRKSYPKPISAAEDPLWLCRAKLVTPSLSRPVEPRRRGERVRIGQAPNCRSVARPGPKTNGLPRRASVRVCDTRRHLCDTSGMNHPCPWWWRARRFPNWKTRIGSPRDGVRVGVADGWRERLASIRQRSVGRSSGPVCRHELIVTCPS